MFRNLIALLLLSTVTHGQSTAITYIAFKYYSPKTNGAEILVTGYTNQAKSAATLEINSGKTKRKVAISIQDYNEIVHYLLLVKSIPQLKDVKIKPESSLTELQFGDVLNRTTFTVSDLEQRKNDPIFREFCAATTIMLQYARVRLPGIH